MSRSDKCILANGESLSNFNTGIQTSSEKIIKSETQSINNFCSISNSQKWDKLVQTDNSATSFSKLAPEVQEITPTKENISTSTVCITSLEDLEDKLSLVLENKSATSTSHEKRAVCSMESRKQQSDNKSKNSINSRTTSDLEKKKLEAELKAAEEIAKIKETIIEKRLAFELASIQDVNDHHQKIAHASTPHPDLRALEESAKKKQMLIESNLSQELESLEYQNRMQTPRPPLLPLNSYGPRKQYDSSSGKTNTFKTDSSSSVLNTIRNVAQIDRKFNLDKQHSGSVEVREPNPVREPTNHFSSNDPRYTDNRLKMDDRYSIYSRPEPQYFPSGMHSGNTHSIWKSAMAKIKKKIKSSKGNSEDWRPYLDERKRGK